MRGLAGVVAASFLLRSGRRLFEKNLSQFNLPLSKLQKLQCGGYIILRDFADGLFPPTFDNQAKAYEAEIEYNTNLPGQTLEETNRMLMRKPFWDAHGFEAFTKKYTRLLRVFEGIGLKPGSRLLELGCGSGWMSEFLALGGYSVLGTTISHHDVELASKRIPALKAKECDSEMKFVACPMESVAEAIKTEKDFDAVFVFEALHHAFDWKAAIQSAASVLRPGGWMILANEPNRMHTFISYRVARLSNTHEIGMSRSALIKEMRSAGLGNCRAIAPRFNNRVTPHWIVAQKLE
jgi:2-polyprenyl-3-methyl-5-hydroxy-6-metoxy-1,4-benzoquinol methylase